jgi:hypothetical protein
MTTKTELKKIKRILHTDEEEGHSQTKYVKRE